MKIVEVTWLDAVHQFGPVNKCEVDEGNPVKTIGYLVKRDKKFISIAMEYWPEQDVYRNVTTIPASIVKKVRYVER